MKVSSLFGKPVVSPHGPLQFAFDYLSNQK